MSAWTQSKRLQKYSILAAAGILALLCARFQTGVFDATPSAALLLAGCSAYIVLDLRDKGKWERIMLLCGYAIRLALILCAVFVLDSLSAMPIQLGDAQGFYNISLEYYAGDFSIHKTNYPYVIYTCHLLFGAGRIIPLYLNVFCWYLIWKVIRSAIHRCSARMALILMAVWSFLPANIWLSTELLRESIMALFIALSFYFLIRWMDGGNWVNIVLSVVCSFPAIWLHTVSIALWGGIGFSIVLWSRERHRWALGKRRAILLIGLAVAAACFFAFRLYRYLPYSYIPSDLSWRSLASGDSVGGFKTGRTDYLQTVSVDNIWEFAFWTVVRCVYFWLSPMVFNWNSWSDPVVALADALPLAALIVLTIIRPKQKGDGKWLAGIAALLCYTLMFAWGTRNAGTAIRHRNLLLALLLMTCALRRTSKELEKTDV